MFETVTIRNSRRTQESGFTLIEVIIGLLIVAAASASMYYGIIYARSELRKISIQERALQELNNEIEFWMARVAYQGGRVQTSTAVGARGREVILYSSEDDPDNAILGTIYRESIEEEFHESNPGVPFYVIEAWIEWDDYLGESGEMNEIRMRTGAFKYN